MQNEEMLRNLFLFLEDPDATEFVDYRKSIIDRLKSDPKGREWLDHAQEETKPILQRCKLSTGNLQQPMAAARRCIKLGTNNKVHFHRELKVFPDQSIADSQPFRIPAGRRKKLAIPKGMRHFKKPDGSQAKGWRGTKKHEHTKQDLSVKIKTF